MGFGKQNRAGLWGAVGARMLRCLTIDHAPHGVVVVVEAFLLMPFETERHLHRESAFRINWRVGIYLPKREKSENLCRKNGCRIGQRLQKNDASR